MASSITASPPPPKPAPPDEKKLKIQELPEEASASKGIEADSKTDASAGNSVEGEGPSQEHASDQEKKVAQETDAGQQLKDETSTGAAGMTSVAVPKTATGTETKGALPSVNLGEQHEANGSNDDGTTASNSLSDFKKKQRRAERFGVDLQVSEQEKRRLRAARFGTQGNGTAAADKTESERRHARVARFGIVDDEVKKKMERFGLESEEGNSTESKKRKARAARFGGGPNEDISEMKEKVDG